MRNGGFKSYENLQEAEDDDLVVLIDTMAWAGPDALVLACSLYNNEDSDVEVEPCSLSECQPSLICTSVTVHQYYSQPFCICCCDAALQAHGCHLGLHCISAQVCGAALQM